ncbi:hypothetical protein [Corallococcus macrosporus]|uniref:DUF4157 domain-containing protein n=1 Tax=Corallococcus macrosporus DSM 14697 TaxID=1189310 RepID=A0A250JRT4_9BACT|nr:hypothetical protein [Corallococcus macrosporus]ATB46368.1 hypothetical protein MYMAC_001960 [Corallococcus macrosporus DSM 14697]
MKAGNVVESFGSRATGPQGPASESAATALALASVRPGAIAVAERIPPADLKAHGAEEKSATKGLLSRIGSIVTGGLRRVGDAVGGLVTGAKDAVVGLVRNGMEATQTLASGLGQVFTGRFREGFGELARGLVQLGQTPVDAVLMVGGRALSAVQTLLGVEPVRRGLTGDEEAALRQVYGDALDYSSISIKEGDAGLLTASGRPFAHGNTIYIPKRFLPLQADLLVHEAAHVWQHQNGGTDYMSEALFAQTFGDGYNLGKALREGKGWSEMNPEQQAELLEQGYRAGFFETPPKRLYVDGVDYTAQLEAALREVRAGRGAP